MMNRRAFLLMSSAILSLAPFRTVANEQLAEIPVTGLIVLGHVDHGKTTLTSAITKQFGSFTDYATVDDAPEMKSNGVTHSMSTVEATFDVGNDLRIFQIYDCPGHADYIKAMIAGAAQMDAAILVVNAADGPMPQTREHVALARDIGIRSVVVYLSKIDLVDDDELVELVEIEVRELLDSYEFAGDDVEVIAGSPQAALDNGDPAIGETSITALMDVINTSIPLPTPAKDRPFIMAIENVYSLSGRGTVVSGPIETGVIRVGAEVEVVGFGDTLNTSISSIEMFRKSLDEAVAGDTPGLFLRGINKGSIKPGQVVAMAGNVATYRKFDAAIYALSKGEGGRETPFFSGYRPQFDIRKARVTGEVKLPEGVEIVMPADNLSVSVTLLDKIALSEGQRFAMHEGGRLVGIGVVSDLKE